MRSLKTQAVIVPTIPYSKTSTTHNRGETPAMFSIGLTMPRLTIERVSPGSLLPLDIVIKQYSEQVNEDTLMERRYPQ